MAKKYYAVKVGVKPGIYNSWAECEKLVKGYNGAKFKGFETLEEAKAFMGDFGDLKVQQTTVSNVSDRKKSEAYAFVDGSFNIDTGVYGYGGFLIFNDQKYILQGNGNDEEMSSMRNVSGEILGAMAAIKKATELGLDSIDIYYDYMGIEMWAEGSWKRNKKGTIEYYNFIQEYKNRININFIKVKGHSGIEGNEEADRLAKASVGIN